MKLIYLSAVGLSLLTLVSVANRAEADPSNNGYRIAYFQNCRLVETQPMTDNQLASYRALQALEKTMRTLEIPIKDIEQQANDYGKEMERLAKLAVIEQEDSTLIHHERFAELENAGKKLEALMREHDSDFAAIEAQGDKIGQAGSRFENALNETRPAADYDSIRIIAPNEEAASGCAQDADRV